MGMMNDEWGLEMAVEEWAWRQLVRAPQTSTVADSGTLIPRWRDRYGGKMGEQGGEGPTGRRPCPCASRRGCNSPLGQPVLLARGSQFLASPIRRLAPDARFLSSLPATVSRRIAAWATGLTPQPLAGWEGSAEKSPDARSESHAAVPPSGNSSMCCFDCQFIGWRPDHPVDLRERQCPRTLDRPC
jgi:hypothetical protein